MSDNAQHTDQQAQAAHRRGQADALAASVPKLMMAAHNAAASVMSGEHTLKKTGQGQNFWQFREYDTQDRPQDIDWRQSAKSDRVFIREKEHQSAQTLLLWVDDNDGMNWHSDKKLLSKRQVGEILALALAILAINNGEMFKFFREKAKLGRTDKALEDLAIEFIEQNLNSEGEQSLNDLPAISWTRRSIPILVSDFLNPVEDSRKIFSSLAEHSTGGIIIHVMDPAELELPYQGRVRFTGVGPREEELVENISAIRPEYMSRITQHREMLSEVVKKCGWFYVFVKTDEDLGPVMQKIWAVLSEQLHKDKRG